MKIDAGGIALVIAAIGGAGGLVTAIGNFILAQQAAKTARLVAQQKAEKDAADDQARKEARYAQLEAMNTLAEEQRATHKLVDGAHTALTGEVVALKDVISKGQTPPSMPADEAAPAQVTQDGGVVSVGKPEEKTP
jgi:hypothetical protein